MLGTSPHVRITTASLELTAHHFLTERALQRAMDFLSTNDVTNPMAKRTTMMMAVAVSEM